LRESSLAFAQHVSTGQVHKLGTKSVTAAESSRPVIFIPTHTAEPETSALGLDPGHDLGPGLVHHLEPRGLHLGVFVRDGAGGVVAPAVLVDLARVSLVELINWTYLSQEVDLGNANDHGKSALRSA
jgi:hypothetical protein